MDVQTLCLGVLNRGDATGYEIRKMFEDGPYHHFLEASYGSIYPALTRLTERQLLSFRTEEQEGRPGKKIYSITEMGRAKFQKALLKPPAVDKFRSEFLFIMMFADQLPLEHVKELLDRQIADLKRDAAEIAEMMVCADTPGRRFVNGFGQEAIAASIDYLERNRDWLESDIAQVRRTAAAEFFESPSKSRSEQPNADIRSKVKQNK